MTRFDSFHPLLLACVVPVAALLAPLAACTQSVGQLDAVRRGDRAFARGETEEALAEYRLAILEGNEGAGVYGRVGHTYAVMGRVDEAGDNYAKASAEDSVWADQAVADLVRIARKDAARNDLYGVASAMRRALQFRPGLSVGDLALPLARHYASSGEYGRALPFFQRALAAVPSDSAPDVMFEAAMAYEEIGDCARAVVFYEQYRAIVPRSRRKEVDWHLGNCSYRYGLNLLQEGKLEDALHYLNTTIDLGEPRSVQGEAYFQKGQVLSLMGACGDALSAYRQVSGADVAGVGSLVSRSQKRIDELRFGGYLDSFDPASRCGLPPPRFKAPPGAPATDSLGGASPDSAAGASTDSLGATPGARTSSPAQIG